MYIYVEGIGGLGNSLFQIYTALYYVNKYNYNIILVKDRENDQDSVLINGTGVTKNLNKKKNTNFISYKDSIFNKCEWISYKEMNNYITLGSIRSIESKTKTNIRIGGYCQNINSITINFDLIYNYLNLQDNSIISYINNKYGDINNCICIGVRMGYDHSQKDILSSKYYEKALETYKQMNIDISNIIILSDTNNAWNDILKLNDKYPGNTIIEPDIIQFYIGIMCKHYILSISTYHLWIAYLGTHKNHHKNVIYPPSWRLPKDKLILQDWICIDNFS